MQFFRPALRVLLITTCGTSAAFLATRMVQEGYEAEARLWIEYNSWEAISGHRERTEPQGWLDLFHSRYVLGENAVNRNLTAEIDRYGRFLLIKLRGQDPEDVVDTLNEVVERYATVTAELKAEKLEQIAKILAEQLAHAEQSLRDSKLDYYGFLAQTGIVPKELRASEELPVGSEELLSRSLDIAALKRRAESAEEFYIALAQRQEEALLQAAANIPDIQILHRPQYAWPLGPSFRPIYIISGVFLLSLLVALWSVWMVNRMEKRAKS